MIVSDQSGDPAALLCVGIAFFIAACLVLAGWLGQRNQRARAALDQLRRDTDRRQP